MQFVVSAPLRDRLYCIASDYTASDNTLLPECLRCGTNSEPTSACHDLRINELDAYAMVRSVRTIRTCRSMATQTEGGYRNA